MLAAYARFIADYVAFNDTALIIAYFGPGGIYVRNIWDRPVAVSLEGGGEVRILLPGEAALLIPYPTVPAVTYFPPDLQWSYYSSVYRWVRAILTQQGGEWFLWINGVLAYRGAVNSTIIGTSPQGHKFVIEPNGIYGVELLRGTLGAPLSGWTYIGFAPFPYASENTNYTIYVYPGVMLSSNTTRIQSTYVTDNGDTLTIGLESKGSYIASRGFGVVAPNLYYEAVVRQNGSSLQIYWYDPAYSQYDPKGLRVDTMTAPGRKEITIAKGKAPITLYYDDKIWLGIIDGSDILLMGFAVPYTVDQLMYIYSSSSPTVYGNINWEDGEVSCSIRTNGYENFIDWPTFGGDRYFNVQCYRWKELYRTQEGYSWGYWVPITPYVEARFHFNDFKSGYVDIYVDGEFYQRINLKKYWAGLGVGWLLPFPTEQKLQVYWNGTFARVWCPTDLNDWHGLLSFGVNTGMTPPGNRAICYTKPSTLGAYKYTLNVKMTYNSTTVDKYIYEGSYYYLIEVNAAGRLILYLWDRPVSFDAYKGKGYIVEKSTPVAYSGPPAPEPDTGDCPVYRTKEVLDQYIRNETKTGPYTTISTVVKYKVTEVSCTGSVTTYVIDEVVDTSTLDGTTLFVTDTDKQKYCVYPNVSYNRVKGYIGCQ
jgi:hypothetical protein